MRTIFLPQELEDRVQAVARPHENLDTLLEQAVREFVERREGLVAAYHTTQMQARQELEGSFRSIEESIRLFRERFGLPPAEYSATVIDDAETILASLPPEKIDEAKQLGLL